MSKRIQQTPELKPQPKVRRRSFHTYSSPSGKDLSNESANPSEDVLAKEIAALREILNDLVVHYHNTQDIHLRLAIADRIALFTGRISQLARAQHYLSPPPDPFLAELDATCQQVTKDWPLMELFRTPPPSPPYLEPPHPTPSCHALFDTWKAKQLLQ
jgi:hypothetical protein